MEAREQTPPSGHTKWRPAAGQPDPVALLEEQNTTREQDLVPVRHGRMMASPFTFYRGAAKIMATDLKDTPVAGYCRGLHRACEAARDDAVERDRGERARLRRLAAAFLGEHDLLGVEPFEVAHLRVSHQVDAPACALSLRAKRAAAGGLHAGHHSGRRGAVREAADELAEQRVGVPLVVALEQLAGTPAAAGR